MILNKTIKTLVVAASFVVCGPVSAAAFPWTWSGSLHDFVTLGSVFDKNPPTPVLGSSSPTGTGDGDTTFTYVTSNNFDLHTTSIAFTEQHLSGGMDLYNVGVSFVAGQGFGSLGYLVSTTDPEGFNLASLGSLPTLGGNGAEVVEQIYTSEGGTLLLTLNSINGATVPSSGLSSFAGYQSFYVLNTIVANNGLVQDFHNNLGAVPVPGAVWLFGSALVGFVGKNLRKRIHAVA